MFFHYWIFPEISLQLTLRTQATESSKFSQSLNPFKVPKDSEKMWALSLVNVRAGKGGEYWLKIEHIFPFLCCLSLFNLPLCREAEKLTPADFNLSWREHVCLQSSSALTCLCNLTTPVLFVQTGYYDRPNFTMRKHFNPRDTAVCFDLTLFRPPQHFPQQYCMQMCDLFWYTCWLL